VAHLPPGTSKWNRIEHRLFAYISQNWRGKPLVIPTRVKAGSCPTGWCRIAGPREGPRVIRRPRRTA
jgi:Rhodopirellula transposase DDE domain